MKAFKKGDKVTIFNSWDDKGTVFYVHAIVYACGTKKMVLTSEETGEELGRDFQPVRVSKDALTFTYCTQVVERVTDAEAEQICLLLGAKVVAHYRAKYEQNIKESKYPQSWRDEIAKLHEPRALKGKRVY